MLYALSLLDDDEQKHASDIRSDEKVILYTHSLLQGKEPKDTLLILPNDRVLLYTLQLIPNQQASSISPQEMVMLYALRLMRGEVKVLPNLQPREMVTLFSLRLLRGEVKDEEFASLQANDKILHYALSLLDGEQRVAVPAPMPPRDEVAVASPAHQADGTKAVAETPAPPTPRQETAADDRDTAPAIRTHEPLDLVVTPVQPGEADLVVTPVQPGEAKVADVPGLVSTVVPSVEEPVQRTTFAATPLQARKEEHIDVLALVPKHEVGMGPVLTDERPVMAISTDSLTVDSIPVERETWPYLAIKTNMLFDLLAAPNLELEVPFGPQKRLSLMAEAWSPWYSIDNTYAYQIQAFGLEMRYWTARRNKMKWRALSGPFFGIYYGNAMYDLEWDGTGDQGEVNSVGLSGGYSWPVSSNFNIEVSLGLGYIWGPYRHYMAEYNNTHLIWKYTGRTQYVGPTKLKVSMVWMLGGHKRKKEKGDEE